MAVHLVCEGPRGGLDERVLDLLVVQRHGLAAQTAPAGGSKALGAVSSHLRGRSPADAAVSVADRD